MNWQTIKLGEVCKFLNGGTPAKSNEDFFIGDIPWITGADINGSTATSARSFITEEAIRKSATNKVEAGTVLLVTRTSVGKVAIAGMDLCFSQDITAIQTAEDKIDKPFLVHFLRTKADYFKENARGATIQGITRQVVENLEIPLPPLPEQKRLASILDSADQVRRLRAQTLEKLDELVAALFLDSFGEPANWPMEKLGDITSVVSSGSTPLGGSTTYLSQGILFIRSQNVLMNGFDFSDAAFISEEVHQKMRRTWVQRDDVLLNITGASIGRTHVYSGLDAANVNQHVCIIRPIPQKLSPVFLSHYFSSASFQSTEVAQNNGATRQAFNFQQIKNFSIPLPPLPLQQQFAARVEAIEAVKARAREAGVESDALFLSLQERAFAGAL